MVRNELQKAFFSQFCLLPFFQFFYCCFENKIKKRPPNPPPKTTSNSSSRKQKRLLCGLLLLIPLQDTFSSIRSEMEERCLRSWNTECCSFLALLKGVWRVWLIALRRTTHTRLRSAINFLLHNFFNKFCSCHVGIHNFENSNFLSSSHSCIVTILLQFVCVRFVVIVVFFFSHFFQFFKSFTKGRHPSANTSPLIKIEYRNFDSSTKSQRKSFFNIPSTSPWGGDTGCRISWRSCHEIATR